MAREKEKNSGGALGFEAKLWLAADKLRNIMDAAEYKHIVLGLIFLKYISDAFEELHAKLLEGKGDYKGANAEDPDEYRAENVFWVPPAARWDYLQGSAKQPAIGKILDDAMTAIERDNPRLKGVLPKEYARPALDKQRLGELIDMIATIQLVASNQPSTPALLPKGEGSKKPDIPSTSGREGVREGGNTPDHPSTSGRGAGGEGRPTHRSVDLLGRVYEYFLTQFASAEGKNGGQFYTPACIVRTLVGMLSPYKGRVYDPCCGSGGMFVQSERFVEAHGGRVGDISIYGQESNATTRRLALMNLAIRGFEADLGPEHADTFRRDLHPDLRADYVLANPPFNDSDWFRKDDDPRWRYGVPPKGNANFAWVQHFLYHLAPEGTAGFVLANGSMSSNQSGEGEIRKALIEADLVDCMVAMPGQLFYSTQIPVCLWFIRRNKSGKPSPAASRHPLPVGEGRGEGKLPHRDRRGETLFIDARKMGQLIDRVHRELTDDDIEKIVGTYRLWRGDPHPAFGHPLPAGEGRCGTNPAKHAKYEDVPGFCKSATTQEIASHGWVLTPGRYVGAEEVEDDGEPFSEKMTRLVTELNAQFAESAKFEKAIKANLKGLGYEV